MQTDHYMANMDKPGRADRLGPERVPDGAAPDRAPGRTVRSSAAAAGAPSPDPTAGGPPVDHEVTIASR